MLKLTYLPIDFITDAFDRHSREPEARVAQKLLASTMTDMIHGKQALEAVLKATESLFGGSALGDLNFEQVTEQQFLGLVKDVKKQVIKKAELRDLSSLVVACGLRSTKAEVRRLMQQNGVSLNNKAVLEDR